MHNKQVILLTFAFCCSSTNIVCSKPPKRSASDASNAEKGQAPTYNEYLSRVRGLLKNRGPFRLRMTWKPTAPAAFQAQDEYVAVLNDDTLVALFEQSGLDDGGMLTFTDEKITSIDNSSRTWTCLDGL